MSQRVAAVAVRNGTKKRPQAWRVHLDGETEWRDVHPMVGMFLMTIATWGSKVSRRYNRAPSDDGGPANWYVVTIYDDNHLADLLSERPDDLPIIPHNTGRVLWAWVELEVREAYAARFFSPVLAGGVA